MLHDGLACASADLFGGALGGGVVCLAIPPIAGLLCIVLAGGVGYVTYSALVFFEASDGATYVVSGQLTLAALGAHFAGAQFMQDISDQARRLPGRRGYQRSPNLTTDSVDLLE